jgi:outer membrane biosynthesis protein TonB
MSARSTRAFAALCACAVLVACQAKEAPPEAAKREPAPEAEPTPPEPPETPQAEPTPEPTPEPPRTAAEGPSGDPEAVLALLVDGERAAALPLVDSDPGMEFDPRLVDKLAPRVEPFAIPPVAKVKQAPAEVQGELDREVIRRVVRAHLNEARLCYERVLTKQPTLGGKVRIDFVIGAQGKVSVASVGETTLGNPEVAACIAKRVKRWTFPPPKDGKSVKVSYPFLLRPG